MVITDRNFKQYIMKTTDPPIKVSEKFNVTAKVLWEAITEVDKMKLWFFDNLPSFKAIEGHQLVFDVFSEDRCFRHIWEVIEVINQEKISVRWTYEGIAGESIAHFAIGTNPENGVSLTVTTEVIVDFPSDIPEFEPESCEAGWKYFIQKRLAEYLAA